MPMRTKEEAHDYRYFPEPDLVPFKIEKALVEKIRQGLPELPNARRTRFIGAYNMSEYDSSVIISDSAMSDFFEASAKIYDKPKVIVNWLMGDISGYMNSQNMEFKALKITPQRFCDMLRLIDNSTISGKIAKRLLLEMLETGKTAEDIIKAKGLSQISDTRVIEAFAEEVINENQKVVADYLSGKEKSFLFLVGALMKKTKEKANPQLANETLKKMLERQGR
jgi:aspartyl-tRNA(Asn)/glutamyl-tRNA(Gln) amidotransferase subunit B